MVYDGGHVEHNCTDINKATFSYNAAVMLQGAAFMYNYVSRRCAYAYPVILVANTPTDRI